MPRACANAGASNTAKNSRIHRSMAQLGTVEWAQCKIVAIAEILR
jgi:hypothetical protein